LAEPPNASTAAADTRAAPVADDAPPAPAVVAGALLPQRTLNEPKVEQYIAEHNIIGPWLDRLQFFDVFSSFWFTAIYALLFISLVGCLTPRMLEHVRSLRAMSETPSSLSTAKHSNTSRAVETDLRPPAEGGPRARHERRGVVLHHAGSKA